MDGTNWQNADAKGIWRPFGFDGSAGDQLRRSWRPLPAGESGLCVVRLVSRRRSTGTGQLYSDRRRRNRHRRAVAAGRLEDPAEPEADARRTAGKLAGARRLQRQHPTDASDAGAIIVDVVPIDQPQLNSTNFSPKASLSYDPNKDWNITAQFRRGLSLSDGRRALSERHGRRRRDSFANPLLKPEQDFTGELNIERHWNDGRVRLTLFKENTNNAHHLADQHS